MRSHPLINGRDFKYSPPNTALQILYEDDHLAVLDKPAGLLSVPGNAPQYQDSLQSRMQAYFPGARPAHRLDMATSGLIVFAKTAHALRHLGMQFEKRKVEKTYTALVAHHMAGKTGVITLPLVCDWPNRPLQKVDFKHGKFARTHWETVQSGNNKDDIKYTRVKLYPETGRSHQLRVHLLALGHPVLGDRLYGDDTSFNAASRLCLHASHIALRQPDGGAWVKFVSPCPF